MSCLVSSPAGIGTQAFSHKVNTKSTLIKMNNTKLKLLCTHSFLYFKSFVTSSTDLHTLSHFLCTNCLLHHEEYMSPERFILREERGQVFTSV